MALSFAAAASARASCRNRRVTLSKTMAAITVPARASPVAKEMDDKMASRITSGLRVIFSRRISQPWRCSWVTSFGPAVRSRSSASVWVGQRERSADNGAALRRPCPRPRGPREKHGYCDPWPSKEARWGADGSPRDHRLRSREPQPETVACHPYQSSFP